MIFPTLAIAAEVEVNDARMTISTGYGTSFAIQYDGTLWAWGRNAEGQLGDGTTINRYTPVKVMDEVIAVSAGYRHTTAIRTDGSLWAWGWNEYGQLGEGTTIARHTPIKVLDDVISVASGDSNTVAIRADGSLWSWGRSFFEERDIDLYPVRVMENVTAVATGEAITMVIKADGSLWGWGNNSRGMIGNGTTSPSWIIVSDKIMDDVISVSIGFMHVAAIRADGSLWTWGRNHAGQLGDSTTEERLSPVKVLENVATVSAGIHYTLAVTTDGTLWGWGDVWQGQFRLPATDSFTHTPVEVMSDVIAASAKRFLWWPTPAHALVLRADGSLWACGDNRHGQLGDGTTTSSSDYIRIMDNVMLPGNVAASAPLPPPIYPPRQIAVFTIGNTFVAHRGFGIIDDVAPFMLGDRVMVPLSSIATVLGATTEWIDATRSVEIQKGETHLTLTIDVPLPDNMGTPVIVSDRTFVPLRYVVEMLNANVEWDADTQTVRVYE